MSRQARVAVLGGGSWGTALVKILQENLSRVSWFIRDPSQIGYIRTHGHNPRYLVSLALDTGRIHFYNNPGQAVEENDILLIAIPSASVSEALEGISQPLTGKIAVSGIKGIIPGCNHLVSEYFRERHQVLPENYVVISGPCHSEEVALEKLSYLTLASVKASMGRMVAELLECRYIKTNVIQDVAGTEYSASLKNIMAIAAGISHGLNYGDNFLAVLVSNAIGEMKRFLHVVHPQTRDIKGSSYLGDLIVTAYSQFSRNRTFGTMIGKGYSVRSALLEMGMAVEGYPAVRCIHEMNKKYRADMPITDAVYNILYQNLSAEMEIRKLTEHLR